MKKLALATGLVMAMGLATGAQAHPENEGYWDVQGKTIWKTGTGGCWRHGFWKPENAVEGCDGYVAPVVAAPEPAPAPHTPKPVLVDAEEKHIVYFDFDSSKVDSVKDITDYIASLKELDAVRLVGHADRIGTNAYNDALSERRVLKVQDALVAGGVDANKITTGFMGETAPAKSCTGHRGADLIDCLRANRRVEIAITGKKVIMQ
ncbi:OmpA family protein [Neptuniibacter sp. CAU 1671]|uniref:OmpA family protein n=1 Tax=Neptuniibacter sp. CAU 1671 TaxID=3032593 RepID=UPI0023DC146A|nr:OmpA family protein [Neptuniibacter sp. CAU 1671]MDF2181486.1 OmpA family protein [Neptuniibacter sp. CAU 1671]